MKKIIIFFSILILSGCATQQPNNIENEKCDRYEPMTECNFRVALLMAMTEKTYAGYSLGLSELVILQTLKDDFQFYYVGHSIGEVKNSSLDIGKSCNESRIAAYRLEKEFNSNFRELALSSMKEGQKMMINYKLSTHGAKKIIDKNPLVAIKDADTLCVKQNEAAKK